MEWNDRMTQARKAAGLTQEQLGELVGISRQAVSKWEAGQTVPDALTVARLCQALQISADYLLLGQSPSSPANPSPAPPLPDICPCCGRPVSGTLCPVCGYPLPAVPPRGPQYAICSAGAVDAGPATASALEKYCGLSPEYAKMLAEQCYNHVLVSDTRVLLRRNLTDSAAQYLAAHLQSVFSGLVIVLDEWEDDDALLTKRKAMELPPSAHPENNGLGFWGVVGAVIVALLLLSLF